MIKNFGYFLRKVRWRLRSILGVQAGSVSEIQYRLNRLPLTHPPGQRFPFPWGTVQYASASDLRGQFTEIFVQRHYAFQATAAEPVIVDAGGNIGMSAIWFKQTYPRDRMSVYEA